MWLLLWSFQRDYLRKSAELARLKAMALNARSHADWHDFVSQGNKFCNTLWMKFDAQMFGELKGIYEARYRHFLPPNHPDYVVLP